MPIPTLGTWKTMHKDGVKYHIVRPSYPVNIFVDHFMIGMGYPEFKTERVFPNNKIELFFNLGDTNHGRLTGDRVHFEFSKTILSGLRSSFLQIFPGTFFFIAGMRFTLFGFNQLMNIPASEIQDRNFSATDVVGKEMDKLREVLGELNDPAQLVQVLDLWVRSKLKECASTYYPWCKIDSRLRDHRFRIKEELPGLLGYSYKHSLQLIKQMCGLYPKTVQRIYRLELLMGFPELLETPEWSGLSYQFGFSDQSHMIREFRKLTGFTPAEFLQNGPKDFLLKRLR